MRIGLDARLLPYLDKEGMAYYSLHLIENLLKNDKANDYILFYNLFIKGDRRFVLDLRNVKNACNRIFWVPGRVLGFLWTKIHFPPIDFILGKLDIFHTLTISSSTPYFFLPPQIKGKKIITLHDIFPLMFPDKTNNVFDIQEYKKGFKNVVKNVDAIICVSNSARKDLIRFTGIPEEKTHMVYSGISEDFYKVTDLKKISRVLNKYRIAGKYLLNVSRLDYNKNIVNLIKAFYIFRKDHDLKLVIVGKRGNVRDEVFATIDKLGIAKDIIYLDYVNREDLVVLYSAAEIFVFPSFYETFGFPNLEAMKCEVPVISSNIATIKEITQDAALLVDPYSPSEIAKAMSKAACDWRLRNDLINKGRERVKFFSWEKTAKDTLEIYKKVVYA